MKITKPKEIHLREVMTELVLYLDAKGYNKAQIGRIFNRDRSYIKRIVDNNKPKGATP